MTQPVADLAAYRAAKARHEAVDIAAGYNPLEWTDPEYERVQMRIEMYQLTHRDGRNTYGGDHD